MRIGHTEIERATVLSPLSAVPLEEKTARKRAWERRGLLASQLLGALLLVVPSTAYAGGLAKTARGVDNASATRGSSSRGGGRSSRGRSANRGSRGRASRSVDHRRSARAQDGRLRGRRNQRFRGRRNGLFAGWAFLPSPCLWGCGMQTPGALVQPTLDLRVGIQNVRNSDTSVRGDALVLFGLFGVHLSADRYMEHIEDKGGTGQMQEDVHINLQHAAFVLHLGGNGRITADAMAGLGSASSSHFETIGGGMFGIRLTAQLDTMLKLHAEGRVMRLENDINVQEAAVSAQVSNFWLGYRSMKFDVGPALAGPELGLRFSF